MGRFLSLLLASALAFGVATPAAAQRLSPEYRRTVRSALGEFNDGRWEEARALFQQAHEIYPNARTLRGIGMAAFEMRDYVGAYRALLECLASDERPLTRRQREATEALLEETRAFIGRFMVVVSPAEATLKVDHEDAQLENDGYILLAVGQHTLTATLDGYRDATEVVTVQGREDDELRVELREIPPEPVPQAPPPPPDDGMSTTVPLVLLASAGVLAACAAIGAVWIGDRGSEVDRCESVDPATDICTNLDTLEGERSAALGFTLVMGGGAIVAAAVGAYLLLFGDDEATDTEREAAAACGLGPRGVACAGRF